MIPMGKMMNVLQRGKLVLEKIIADPGVLDAAPATAKATQSAETTGQKPAAASGNDQ